ncbi:HNH endonuclease [Streptomyces sp. NPDC094034]
MHHLRPLTPGGEDTGTNVQPFCRNCHPAKTGEEFEP